MIGLLNSKNNPIAIMRKRFLLLGTFVKSEIISRLNTIIVGDIRKLRIFERMKNIAV
jgi:hypothetical protein